MYPGGSPAGPPEGSDLCWRDLTHLPGVGRLPVATLQDKELASQLSK